MEKTNTLTFQPGWTWADQVSSYRFWASCLYFISLYLLLSNLHYFPLAFSDWNLKDLSAQDEDRMINVQNYKMAGFLCALPIAAFMARYRNARIYLSFGVLAFPLVVLYLGPYDDLIKSATLFLAQWLACMVLMTLLAVMLSAGARPEGAVVVVGLALISLFLFDPNSEFAELDMNLFGLEFNFPWENANALYVTLVLGLLCYWPVKQAFFVDRPAPRGSVLRHKKRMPHHIFWLTLVPGYVFYWLYRIPGEVRQFKNSSLLLSSHGTLICFFIAPFMLPLILLSFADAIEESCEDIEVKQALHRSRSIMICSLLFLPAACAMIQANLNRLALHRLSVPPVGSGDAGSMQPDTATA